MEGLSVSVCLASYNGIKYIGNQIDSILPQLKESDELLISDDGSTDGTLEYVQWLSQKDKRVKVISGPQEGVNANFFSLIARADKDIILIADQDDIWYDTKIDRIRSAFENNPDVKVVLHEDTIFYEDEWKCNSSLKFAN